MQVNNILVYIIMFVLLFGFIASITLGTIQTNEYKKLYNDCMIALNTGYTPYGSDVIIGGINITAVYE